MSYYVFHRTWWRSNPSWPGGREPKAGRKTTIARHVETEEQARELCRQWSARHPPGRLSRRAEYQSE